MPGVVTDLPGDQPTITYGDVVGNTTPVAPEASTEVLISPNLDTEAQLAVQQSSPFFDRLAVGYPRLAPYLEPNLFSPQTPDAIPQAAELTRVRASVPVPADETLEMPVAGRRPNPIVESVAPADSVFVANPARTETAKQTAPTVTKTESAEPVTREQPVVETESTTPAYKDPSKVVIPDSLLASARLKDGEPTPKDLKRAQKSGPKWYNPKDAFNYIGAKLNPETWGRARTAATIGGLALSAAYGGAMIYSGIKHGSMPELPRLPHFGGSGGEQHPTADAITPPAEHATMTPEPHVPHAVPSTETTPPPETPVAPEPEHLRTAVSSEPGTHHASSVSDWSVEALKSSAKDAGLSDAQISQLTHDRHAVGTINHAFYSENASVAHDPKHYLNAHEQYQVDQQHSAADHAVEQYQAKHAAPEATTPETTPADTASSTPDQPYTDAELQKMIKDLQEESAANAPAATTPAGEHELFAGRTARELANMSALGGAVLGGAMLPFAIRQVNRSVANNADWERENEWGHGEDGDATKKIQHHRASAANPATVPEHQSAQQWYETRDKRYQAGRSLVQSNQAMSRLSY